MLTQSPRQALSWCVGASLRQRHLPGWEQKHYFKCCFFFFIVAVLKILGPRVKSHLRITSKKTNVTYQHERVKNYGAPALMGAHPCVG